MESEFMNHPNKHPTHPDIRQNTIASLPEGRGQFWNWGPNYTADPIVITTEVRPQILLIRRQDTNMLALPGGFVDEEDASTNAAALRELREETSLVLKTEGRLVYEGIVNDPRTTQNAWPETAAYLFEIPKPQPVLAADDANSAAWYFIDELNANELYGSHAKLIEIAVEIQRSQKLLEN